MYQDFSVRDTDLRFRGHPILLGSNSSGRPADKCVLTKLDRFLKKELSPNVVEFLMNYSTGTLVKGAIPEGDS